MNQKEIIRMVGMTCMPYYEKKFEAETIIKYLTPNGERNSNPDTPHT